MAVANAALRLRFTRDLGFANVREHVRLRIDRFDKYVAWGFGRCHASNFAANCGGRDYSRNAHDEFHAYRAGAPRSRQGPRPSWH